MFRGDARHTGVYAGTAPQLAGLAWRVQTGGDVTSSPVVMNGRVYAGSSDGNLYAISAADGTMLWRFQTGSAVTGSPAVSSRTVVVTTRGNHAFAVDAVTGKLDWRFDGGRDVPMPWGHETGDFYVSSPVVAGAQVLFGMRDGVLYSLDLASRRRHWTTNIGAQVWSTPAVADGRVFVGAADGNVYAFALDGGARLWRFATTGASLSSAQFGYDRRTVESSPAVVDSTLYVGARDGFLYALSTTTGAERWRFDHKTSWVVTSPAVAGGSVYAGSSDRAFIQSVDATTGAERWRTPTGGIVWSSPAISDSIIYFGDGIGRLHAVNRATGAERWVFRTGESVHSSPTINDSLVIFGSADGGVYALRTSRIATQRAVFFDSTLRRASSVDDPELVARYFDHRGYRRLDSAALSRFLTDRAADRTPSVVVFATDVVIDSTSLRRYLEAGGKVVWPGIPPGIWLADPQTGKRSGYASIDWNAPSRITRVDHHAATFDEHSTRPTPLGVRFGLQAGRSAWGVPPSDVTDVYALDDWGNATSWRKSFGDAPGTGFLRVPSGDLLSMYLFAEYRP